MELVTLDDEIESVGKAIVHAAYLVHMGMGPGLLEKVYEVCMEYELRQQGLFVERQVSLPIHYRGLTFDESLRIDLMVEKKITVEIKSVELVNAIWKAQVLSHLKLSHLHLGYLINFNVPLIKDGINASSPNIHS